MWPIISLRVLFRRVFVSCRGCRTLRTPLTISPVRLRRVRRPEEAWCLMEDRIALLGSRIRDRKDNVLLMMLVLWIAVSLAATLVAAAAVVEAPPGDRDRYRGRHLLDRLSRHGRLGLRSLRRLRQLLGPRLRQDQGLRRQLRWFRHLRRLTLRQQLSLLRLRCRPIHLRRQLRKSRRAHIFRRRRRHQHISIIRRQ